MNYDIKLFQVESDAPTKTFHENKILTDSLDSGYSTIANEKDIKRIKEGNLFISSGKARAGSEEQKLKDTKIRSSKEIIQLVIKSSKISSSTKISALRSNKELCTNMFNNMGITPSSNQNNTKVEGTKVLVTNKSYLAKKKQVDFYFFH